MIMKYEQQTFYVIYDEQDRVRHCGTAEQLIQDGVYKSLNSLYSSVSKIKKGINSGFVVTLK